MKTPPLPCRVLGLALLLLPQTTLADSEPRKFAVGVYHFNVQYCAGGLAGFAEALGAEDLWSSLDVSDEGVQDAIIVESFQPLLALFAAHPDWGADIELQGLMIDAIHARHPDVLTTMQGLDDQVDFDSFHWSDELWTAQPATAIERSFARTRRSFDEAGIRPGASFFTQEGQFGHGMAEIVPGGSVLMLPRNLWGLHGLGEPEPLYTLGASEVIVAGHGWSGVLGETPVEVRWVYMDDGELLATQGMNCYFLPVFRHDPASVAAHEAEIQGLVDQGFSMVTVSHLASELRALGVEGGPLPPIIDGTWQPDDTANLGRWMGDGGVFPETEHDGAVRSSWHRAYRDLRAAETLGIDPLTLDEAWDHLLLAGVSDATGWNPFETEVLYSLDHADAARRLVLPTLREAAGACQGWLSVDPGAQTATCVDSPAFARLRPAEEGGDGGAELVTEDLAVSGELGRWVDPERPDQELFRVTWRGADAAGNPAREPRFPWSGSTARFLPAGQRTQWLELPLAAFAAEPDPVGLPLANGVLSDGTRFLVIDPGTVGLAARFDLGAAEIVFRDETAALGPVERWDVWSTAEEDIALDLSTELVEDPRREVVGTWERRPGIPGCDHAGGSTPLGALVLLLLLFRPQAGRVEAEGHGASLPRRSP